MCVDDEGVTKEITYNNGLWCCNTEKCKGFNNVTCKGKAIPLTEKCVSEISGTYECNSHPMDKSRNSYFPRSHLDICEDR